MLYVSRKEVQKLYKDYCTERDKEEKRTVNRLELSGRVAVLEELFSRSMCLLDEKDATSETKDATQEVKPTEPGRVKPKPAER